MWSRIGGLFYLFFFGDESIDVRKLRGQNLVIAADRAYSTMKNLFFALTICVSIISDGKCVNFRNCMLTLRLILRFILSNSSR